MDEKLRQSWKELVADLIKDKDDNILEDEYQKHIQVSLRLLGWSMAQGEICPKERINVGSNNQLEPDITLKSGGNPVVVIEVKRPNNKITQRQEEQLLSYMRIRRLPFGFYIGSEIRLYYDIEEPLPILVWHCDLSYDAIEGAQFVDFLNKSTFNFERIQRFCKDRTEYIISNNIMGEFKQNIQTNADSVIRNILTDYFVKTKKCNRNIVKSILDSYEFSINSYSAPKEPKVVNPIGIMLSEQANKKSYVMDTKLTSSDNIVFVVSNQWGRYNFANILNLLNKWQWEILTN